MWSTSRSGRRKAGENERLTAGFGLTTDALAPGDYDIAVFVWIQRTARWEEARTVHVTVR